jgi:hypothetical protein
MESVSFALSSRTTRRMRNEKMAVDAVVRELFSGRNFLLNLKIASQTQSAASLLLLLSA